MKKIRTVVIEDEKHASDKMLRLLSRHDGIEVLGVLESVEESIEWFSQNEHPELIFCDIQLGDGMSFAIFEKVRVSGFFIFTTAYDQYALKAFEHNSIDYLLKPILAKDLEDAIEKYQRMQHHFAPIPSVSLSDVAALLSATTQSKKTKLERIIAKVGTQIHPILVRDVSCFYLEQKIVYAQTSQRSFPTDFTLDSLMDSLDEKSFFRINRQTIVNSLFIEKIQSSPTYSVCLRSTAKELQKLSVSRDRVKAFLEFLEG